MAKESASSRIPRLDGASRIPLPGSLRPPTSGATAAARNAQELRVPASSAFPHKRPTTLVGLRPSIAGVNALKRSSSGDHITSALSMVSKKTATAFKMLMGRSETKTQPPSSHQLQQANVERKTKANPVVAAPKNACAANALPASTPRPLTRSDTFVRTDSPSDISIITPHILAQSTPAPSSNATETTTAPQAAAATFRKSAASETSQLLSATTRHALYTTQSWDATHDAGETFAISKSVLEQTLTSKLSPPACSETLDRTVVNAKSALSAANATKVLLKTNLMTTFNVISPPVERLPQRPKQQLQPLIQRPADSTIILNLKPTDGIDKSIESTDAISPVTNATYSNPGSTENLQMLEDVSVPSGFDMDVTLQPDTADIPPEDDAMNATLLALAPRNDRMQLQLNSTLNTERLLDLTTNMLSPTRHMNLFNLSKDYTISASPNVVGERNNTHLLYMTQQHSASVSTTPDCLKHTPRLAHMRNSPPLLLKGAQSDLVLPTRTPDDELHCEPMDVDTATLLAMGARTDEFYAGQGQQSAVGVAVSLQDVNNPNAKQKSRFSFGLDLTESTLDCSIELIDVSLSSTALSHPNNNSALLPQSPCSLTQSQQQLQQQLLKKQNSFELDESLGILTPDQMKEFLDSTNTNNTNNLELPLALNANSGVGAKMAMQQMRIDQTPSPEELPLDPVEVKTDISEIVLQHQQQQQQQQLAVFSSATAAQQQRQQLQQQLLQSSSISTEPVSAHTDTDISKTSDQMTKSNGSKISTSFITSVTSVTSLDTGYQGDGEMSRPASRGASDHSPSNGPAARKGGHVSRQPSFHQQQQQQMPLIRRQDPMTDSDFFTESDADDIFHRGDRRAQVIDGQLYGPMLQQPAASVFISEDPEDSCMESSGIFTDVENRCDEDLAQMRRQDTQEAMGDISPEGECEGDGDDSTETVKSNRGGSAKRINVAHGNESAAQERGVHAANAALGQGQLSKSLTSSTIQSSTSNDRLSAATLSNRTSYCSVDGSTVNVDCKSFSSLEEAFAECLTSADLNSNISSNSNNASINTNTKASVNAKRTKNSTTGSAAAGVVGGSSSSDVGAAAGCEESSLPAPLLAQLVHKVTPPRKHASLSSLCNAVNGDFGAKTEAKFSPQKTATGRGTRSESGTAATQVSPTSSSSSLSLDNKTDQHIKSFNSSCASVAGKRTPRGKTGATKTPSKRASAANASTLNRCSPGASSSHTRKSHTPSKWEAVMNKIESNKALPKKNYNEVKSKVVTMRAANAMVVAVGASQHRSSASTPLLRRSPTATVPSSATHSGGQVSPRVVALLQQRPTDTGPGARAGSGAPQALQSQTTKRLLQGVAARRGRSYSKDSQKSSQSDLSLASGAGGGGAGAGAGSPKLFAKTPLRAAKKRDVRNLSISPTDLGPPPKAQQTAKGTSARTKPAAIALTQKRSTPQSASGSPSTTSTAVSTPTGCGASVKGKSSPVVKKHQSIFGNKRLEASQPAKAPLKEQNRIIGSSQPIASTPTGNKNGSKAETPTELHDLHHNNNNNNITTTTTTATTATSGNATAAGTGVTATVTGTRNNAQTSSPTLGHHAKKAAAVVAGTALLEKKTQSKLLSSRSKVLQTKQQQNQQQQQKHHSMDHAPSATATAEYLNVTELQRLKHLNRHSCNGRLNYEALERHLEQTELLQQQQDKSVEALGVVLQYLVYDLDAFACPMAKSEKAKVQESLAKTVKLLDEAKSTCSLLQDQLSDKEAYYTQREEELQTLHRCELEKVQANFSECQSRVQQQLAALEVELRAKDVEQKRTLDSYRLEMDNKFTQKQQQLIATEARERELKDRLSALQICEDELREKLTNTESMYAARLKDAAEREAELDERLKVLSKELEVVRQSKEHSERELRDKLNLSQDEISVLRLSRKSCSESLTERSSTSIGSPRNSSTTAMATSLEISRLQSEADSLHCVLELKQKEISKLTKQNEELLRDADERVALQGKISLLESRNEMLQSELDIKSEKEKDYQRQIDDMQKAYNHETVKRTRLSYDNEALQWQLKQRSEQLHIVEAKLQELSAYESLNATSLNSSSLGALNRTTSLLNGTSSMHVEDVSPPTSPIIKGVIEKPDSVSWVLEMDDETPEAAASKMVKRAGSFRSVERSPSTRRQLSVSASAMTTVLNCSSSGGISGPNPLSQSMSATSVIRQHSSDIGHEFGSRSHARIRSKSVSVKSTEPNGAASSNRSGKKLVRQHSTSGAKKQHNQLELTGWQEPMGASSPYCGDLRSRTSTACSAEAAAPVERDEVLYRRASATTAAAPRKLITCDTSALNSGERLDAHSLPTHASSMHDLKALKKCQEIQESAGEAMVSGTNSEDEGCSASSDEIVCSASISSGTGTGTGSTSSLNQMKHSHMSLEEEELLLEKINSLNGTPMEVSWSDDADVFANGSTV